MPVTVRSFSKINLGLRIGALRPDGFHELRTVYQTIALHDVVRVSVTRGSGIEIRCDDAAVPKDSTNTCSRIAELAMPALKAKGRVVIEIEKRLPVQGGLGGASGNAVATLLALESVLKRKLPGIEELRLAAEVGSDLPLFLIGGTVLGVGRGEEVYPLADLPFMPCVVAIPEIAVSTPGAFADWDRWCGAAPSAGSGQAPSAGSGQAFSAGFGRAPARELAERGSAWTGEGARPHMGSGERVGSGESAGIGKLTPPAPSDRIMKFSREISAWLGAGPVVSGRRRSGVSVRGGGRAENPLLDLVRTGIENDFEKVVFPKYPELSQVKSVLERAGAKYASLSGSGSAVYGLFDSQEKAASAAKKLQKSGTAAVITSTLTRRQYWKKFLVSGF